MTITTKFGIRFYDDRHNEDIVMADEFLQNFEQYYHKFEDKIASLDGIIEIVQDDDNQSVNEIQLRDTSSWLILKLALGCIPKLLNTDENCYTYEFMDSEQHLVLIPLSFGKIKIIDENYDYGLVGKKEELLLALFHCAEQYVELVGVLTMKIRGEKDLREKNPQFMASFDTAKKALQDNGLL